MSKSDTSTLGRDLPLVKALAHYHEIGQDATLEAIMKTIPGGTCETCGKCCYDNVPLSAVEFIRLVAYLHEQDRLAEAIQDVQTWYIHQFEKVQPCIFLKHNRCSIYPVRPLTCRLFGHQSEKEQAERVKKVLEQNKKLAHALKGEYGIVVSSDVVNHAITQCGFIPDKAMTKGEQDQLFDAVQALDAPYYLKEYIDEEWINLSLIEWFVLSFLDEDQLLDAILSK